MSICTINGRRVYLREERKIPYHFESNFWRLRTTVLLLLKIQTTKTTVFRFPTTVASKLVLGRETVWVTLKERPPPTPAAALFAANRLKPRKRNFDTVGRTGLFVGALKARDWAEATMMLSAVAKLQFGKVKATGAAEGERKGGRYWQRRTEEVLGLLCVDGEQLAKQNNPEPLAGDPVCSSGCSDSFSWFRSKTGVPVTILRGKGWRVLSI